MDFHCAIGCEQFVRMYLFFEIILNCKAKLEKSLKIAGCSTVHNDVVWDDWTNTMHCF